MNRKDFFKSIGIGIGTVVATKVSAATNNFSNDSDLNDQQKQFLQEYEMWLEEFQGFVNKRNKDIDHVSNNKRLMELTAEADKRKAILEEFMKDDKFANYFNDITQNITANIS